tara:strand:+ start:12670 stop:12915 length:246 start_codon:yes stop_codon:yes gene_type:complete
MEYLNKLGTEAYYEKSFRELLNILLENNAFHILKEDWESFLKSVQSISHFDIEMVNYLGGNHYLKEKTKKDFDIEAWFKNL